MIIIGITGSIGMGKTTVSKMLRILKIPVFDSDKTVKEILDKNYDIIEKISEIWPESVMFHQKQKKINKEVLSNKIFESKNERKKLEKIIHPLVKKERTSFLKKYRKYFVVGLDIPLLYETKMDKVCDHIFLVNTTKKIQRKRVLNRDKISNSLFEKIIKSQLSFEEKIKFKPQIINTKRAKFFIFLKVIIILTKIQIGLILNNGK